MAGLIGCAAHTRGIVDVAKPTAPEIVLQRGDSVPVTWAALDPTGARGVLAAASRTTAFDVASGAVLYRLDEVHLARFSPDGSRLVTIDPGGLPTIRDATTGAVLAQPTTDPGTPIAVSPDGSRIFTIEGHQPRLWAVDPPGVVGRCARPRRDRAGDLQPRWGASHHPGSEPHGGGLGSGHRIGAASPRSDRRSPRGASLASDGRHLVTASLLEVTVWDLATGTELRSWPAPAWWRPYTASSDGAMVIGGRRGDRAVWRTETGSAVLALADDTDAPIVAAFAPDGASLVIASDRTAVAWDLASREVRLSLEGHTGDLNHVAFSADGTRLVTASNDGSAIVWDARDGREIGRLRSAAPPWHLARFTADGSQIRTHSNHVAVWDLATGRPTQFEASQRYRWRRRDGELLVARYPRGARVWEVATGRLRFALQATAEVQTAEVCPLGRRIVTAHADGRARVWDATTGAMIQTLSGHRGRLRSAVFSPDGARILTVGYSDGRAAVWDVATGEVLLQLSALDAYFSPATGGDQVVSLSIRKAAEVWDLASGQRVAVLDRRVQAIDFTSDGGIVTRGLRRIAVWDPHTARSRYRAASRWVPGVSGDGTTAVILLTSGTSVVVDATTGRRRARFDAPGGQAMAAVLSASGDRLATSGEDETWVWQVDRAEILHRFPGRILPHGSAFSPDDRFLLTANDRGVHLWDLRSGLRRATLLTFGDGSWAVIDPRGRFDASDQGDLDGVAWVADGEVHRLAGLWARYGEPDLLAKIIADADLREVPPLGPHLARPE